MSVARFLRPLRAKLPPTVLLGVGGADTGSGCNVTCTAEVGADAGNDTTTAPTESQSLGTKLMAQLQGRCSYRRERPGDQPAGNFGSSMQYVGTTVGVRVCCSLVLFCKY